MPGTENQPEYKSKVFKVLMDTYGPEQVPDEKTFYKKLENQDYRKNVHKVLMETYGPKQVADEKTFYTKLGYGEQPKSDIQGVRSFIAQNKEAISDKQAPIIPLGFDHPRATSSSTMVKPSVIKESEEQTKQRLEEEGKQIKERRKDAIANSVAKYSKQNNIPFGSYQYNNKLKEFTEKAEKGELVPTNDKDGNVQLGRHMGLLSNMIKQWKGDGDVIEKSRQYQKMDASTAINILNDAYETQTKEELNPVKEIETGSLAEIGGFIGGMGRTVIKQGVGAKLATGLAHALAPETWGASELIIPIVGMIGGATAIADDMHDRNYISALEKYYFEGKKMGLQDGEAYDKANTQAKRAAELGYVEAFAFAGAGKIAGKVGGAVAAKALPRAASSVAAATAAKGFASATTKFIMHTAAEFAGTSAVVASSSVAQDLSAKELGYKLDNKELFSHMWDKVSDNAKMIFAMTAVHASANGLIRLPGYVSAQAKRLVSSGEPGRMNDSLDALEKSGHATPEEIAKTKEAQAKFDAALKVVEPLNIKDAGVEASIAGKVERRTKLESEVQHLKDNNLPGIEERQKEIVNINEEIKKIHETGDWISNEHDREVPSTSIPLNEPVEIPVEKVEMPVSSEPLKDVKSTTDALINAPLDERIKIIESNKLESSAQLSEAYHKAKSDGSNPELVKSVEDLLSQKEQSKEPSIYENKSDADLEKRISEIDAMSVKDYEENLDEYNNIEKELEYRKNKPKEPIQISDEQKEINLQSATDDIRAEEYNKIKQEYDSRPNEGGTEQATVGVSGEVPSEPTPETEQQTPRTAEELTYRDAGYESEEQSRKQYEKEGNKEHGETYEEYILRRHCK